MAKLLGDEVYKAARSQTTEMLKPMRDAFIAIAQKSSTTMNKGDQYISIKDVEIVLKKLASVYLQFPYSKVCVHWAAIQVLEAMQMLNISVSEELADAIVTANDNIALNLLKE